MIGADIERRTLAVILSVALHSGAFAFFAGNPLIADSPAVKPEPQPTQVRLEFLPPPPQRPEVVEAVQAAPEPPPPQPEPEPSPPPEPEPVAPKPKPDLPPKPKPQSKETATQQPAARPTPPAVAASEPGPAVPPHPAASTTPAPDLVALFKAKLLARIEANKFYPPLARRRNIEGTIQVRFGVDCQGRLTDLVGEGGHLLLQQAATDAVEKSLPLAPPQGVDCPLKMRFAIRFALE